MIKFLKQGNAKINNQDKTITENGTYRADDGYTGLGEVIVNVSSNYLEYQNMDDLLATTDRSGIETGQKAVVYGYSKVDLQENITFTRVSKLGTSFTLSKPVTKSINIYTSPDEERVAQLSFTIAPTYAEISVDDFWSYQGGLIGRYESSDGLTYNAIYEYTGFDYMNYEEKTYHFTYKDIPVVKTGYDTKRKNEETAEYWDIFNSLLIELSNIELHGVYQYNDDVYNRRKVQYLQNVSLSGTSLLNGNSSDVVYTDKFWKLLEKNQIRLYKRINKGIILKIDETDTYKRVVSGEVYIYPDDTDVDVYVDETEQCYIGFSGEQPYDKYTFNTETGEFNLVESTIGDKVIGYDYNTEHSMQKVLSLSTNDKIITYYNDDYPGTTRSLHYLKGTTVRTYQYSSQYSNMYQMVPNQFTLTDNRDLLDNRIALGQNGEVRGSDIWSQGFTLERWSTLLGFDINTLSHKLSPYYNYNYIKPKYAYKPADLVYLTHKDLEDEYINSRDSLKQYGYTREEVTIGEFDISNLDENIKTVADSVENKEHCSRVYDAGDTLRVVSFGTRRTGYVVYVEIDKQSNEIINHSVVVDDKRYSSSEEPIYTDALNPNLYYTVTWDSSASTTRNILWCDIEKGTTGRFVYSIPSGVTSAGYYYLENLHFDGEPSVETLKGQIITRNSRNDDYYLKVYNIEYDQASLTYEMPSEVHSINSPYADDNAVGIYYHDSDYNYTCEVLKPEAYAQTVYDIGVEYFEGKNRMYYIKEKNRTSLLY